MTWLQRYQVRHYFRNSIWLLPVVGMAAGMLIVRALHRLESAMGWQASFQPEGARAVLGTLAASMFTLVVFVSSALLVVMQLASAQLSPRIIGIVFRNPVTKLSISAFMFTFTVTVATLARIDATVPLLTTQLATYSCIASLGLFLYMIDHLGRALRPSGALRSIAQLGKDVMEAVYPRHLGDTPVQPAGPAPDPPPLGEPPSVVVSPLDGVLLAFDHAGLVALARAADCTIELVPQVGDFVATGDPLFRVSRGGGAVPAGALCQSVALGQERTVEQDPTFVFRILVDIAAKALSPAINDPTTAVLVIDQIQHLLRAVGNRDLDEGQVHDAGCRPQLVYRTPDWEDFVQLAVTEIRHFGSYSIQVARRLRAMLENLIRALPEQRRSVLRRELSLLAKTSERSFPEPEDRALAEVSDSQGVGGSPAQSGGEAL
jgi:uncharacterized membrane protein